MMGKDNTMEGEVSESSDQDLDANEENYEDDSGSVSSEGQLHIVEHADDAVDESTSTTLKIESRFGNVEESSNESVELAMGNEKTDSDGAEVLTEEGQDIKECSVNSDEVIEEPVEDEVLPTKHSYGLRRKSTGPVIETSSERDGGRRKYIMNSERQGIPSTCTTCGKTFVSRRAMLRHMKSHKIRTYRCHSCPKYYSSKDRLFDHLVMSHGQEQQEAKAVVKKAEASSTSRTLDDSMCKKYRCSYCPRSYSTSVRLRGHVKSHTSESTKCSICQKVFSDRKGMVVHMGTHGPRSKLMCHLCPNGYLSRQGFRRHLVMEHKLKMKDARKIVAEQARRQHDVFDQVTGSADGTIPTATKNHRSTTPSKSRNQRKRVKKLRAGATVELGKIPNTNPDLKSTFLSALDLRPSNVSHSIRKRPDGIEVAAASVNVMHSISVRSTRSSACKSNDPTTVVANQQSVRPNSTKYTCAVCRRRFYTLSKLGSHMCKRMKIERVSPACTKNKTAGSVDSMISSSTSSPKNSAVEEVVDPQEETMQSSVEVHPKLSKPSGADKNDDVGNKTARNERRNFCDECSKQFPRPTSLAIHILRSHGGKISRLSCSLCGRKFWTRKELHLHLQMSHKVKPKVVQKMGQKSALPPWASSAAVHENEVDRPNSKEIVQISLENSVVSSLDCGVEDSTSSSADASLPVKAQTATSTRCPRSCSHSCGRNTDEINRSGNSGLSRCQRTSLGLKMPAHYQVGGSGMNTELMTCISHIAQAVQILPSIIAGGFQGAHSSSTTARHVSNGFHSGVTKARSRPMSPVWNGNNEDDMKPLPTVIDLTDGKSSTEQQEDSMSANEESHCENCNFCKCRSFQ